MRSIFLVLAISFSSLFAHTAPFAGGVLHSDRTIKTPGCWTLQPYVALAGRFQCDGNRVHAFSELRFSDCIDSSLAQIILGARAAKRFGRLDLSSRVLSEPLCTVY